MPADENVYYVTAREITKGSQLYTQIFHAHPPFHLFLYAGIIWLFGLKIWLLKLFTLLIYTSCGLMTYLLAKERYDERIGFISILLFFISYDAIFATFSFGIELSILFFLISWYILNKKPVLAGIMFGFCLMTRLHLAPLGIILLLYSKEKRKFLFGSGICLVYYGLLLRVPNFFEQVLGFHMSKLTLYKGWLSFLKANLILFILVAYSIKNIKDSFTIELVIAYTAFLLVIGSVFEYHLLIIGIIFCIEGAYALVYSRFKKYLWAMVMIWTVIMVWQVGFFLYEQTQDYNELIAKVSTYEGSIMGEPPLASLIALKGNKNITRNMIDLNFQRREIFNYSNSLVIYNEKRFDGFYFNCTLLNATTIKDETYRLWRC